MIEFKEHIPTWGGITDFNYNLTKYKNKTKKFDFINTCTVDYYLLAMWCATRLSLNIKNYLKDNLHTRDIFQLINCIDDKDWNKAKTIWFFEICNHRNMKNKRTICSFGTEFEFFYKYIHFMQEFKLKEICTKCQLDHSPRDKQRYLFLVKYKNEIVLNVTEKFTCRSCNIEMDKELEFKYKEPCWLVCEISPRLKLSADLLPTHVKLNQKEYKLLCATYNTGASHFVGIFILNNKYYVVDDLEPNSTFERCPKNHISMCFYYLV